MAIIGINGKIGSGKDTIANIIKELSPEYSWENKKFAGKLKIIASILTGIPVGKFESQEFKTTNLGKEWGDMTVRELLQKLGTEALRDNLDRDVWINALWADYKSYGNYPIYGTTEKNERIFLEYGYLYPNWIITDTRFINEAESIKQHGGILIRVRRDSGNTVGVSHPSETALDDYVRFDYEIDNNGTLSDLREKVREILIKTGYYFYNEI
jgi:hypothetical protein